jgi:lipopolysaccharide/colanic/teichoic acid biosynthesis glycosyltransferase
VGVARLRGGRNYSRGALALGRSGSSLAPVAKGQLCLENYCDQRGRAVQSASRRARAATMNWWRAWGKRSFDVVAAAVGLVLLAVPMGAIALLVLLTMGRPVLFRQIRPGRDARPFTLLKFRTMREAPPGTCSTASDAERLTRVGSFLRAWSLDELPSLWNVLKGDMSLVGPRPLLWRYLPFLTDQERQRFAVRPGVTGLAQVSGRNDTPWDRRLALDVEYVERLCARLDLSILLRTLVRVMTRSGVVTAPRTTMKDLDEERRERIEVADSCLINAPYLDAVSRAALPGAFPGTRGLANSLAARRNPPPR